MKSKINDRRLKEYVDMADRLCKILDVNLIGFDPGFLISEKDDGYGSGPSTNIPMWLAKKIVDSHKKIDRKTNKETK